MGDDMTETMSRILSEIDQLSQPERCEIASVVLQSIEPLQENIGDEFEAELSRRTEEIRSGKAVGRSAEDVFARLEGRRS